MILKKAARLFSFSAAGMRFNRNFPVISPCSSGYKARAARLARITNPSALSSM